MNTLEQLYATGKAEIYELIAEYYDILREIREADDRLKKAVLALEPNSERVVNKEIIIDYLEKHILFLKQNKNYLRFHKRTPKPPSSSRSLADA